MIVPAGLQGVQRNFTRIKKLLNLRYGCGTYADTYSGWQLGESRLIIWGADRDVNKNIKSKIANSKYLLNTKIVSSYYMSDQDMQDYIELINNYKPCLIVGYPSSLELFSNYILKNGGLRHSPKSIITGGETLFPLQRSMIQNVFECKVFNRYACREVGPIAMECEYQNGLHIHHNHVYIEIVNINHKDLNPVGDILVTDLDNYVFPLVRYDIGDLGTMKNNDCKCGRRGIMLSSVSGRKFDIVKGTNLNRVSGTYFTLLRKKYSDIKNIQVIQEQYGHITLKLEVEKIDDSFKSNICDELKQKLGDDMKITLQIVDKIEKGPTGKYRIVISNVKQL